MLITVTIFIVSVISFSTTIHAQDTTNCDVCGYCKGVTAQPPYKNPPDDWLKCVKCSYPDLNIQSQSEYASDKTLAENVAPDVDSHYTVVGCISTKPGVFVSQLTSLFFNIVGGIAFLFLLFGAFTIATSRSDYEKLNQGKKTVYGAIAGLLFVIFATFILRFLAVNVFHIPGFQ
jgi:hypothetical protein